MAGLGGTRQRPEQAILGEPTAASSDVGCVCSAILTAIFNRRVITSLSILYE